VDEFVGIRSGTHFDHTLHIDEFDLSCRDCHFGVVHNPATSTDRMNFCLTCHAEMSEDAPQVNDCGICHEAQLAMNQGAGVEGIEEIPSLMYGDAADMTCTDCHTTVTKGVYRPSSATCTSCHDADYGDIFNEWEETTHKRIEKLKQLRIQVETALVEADSAQRDTADVWTIYQNGLRNLKFVKNDGTNSVHNNAYATAILNQVEIDFNNSLEKLDAIW
jgi:hypothetical protein